MKTSLTGVFRANLIWILPLVVLCFFSHPAADDFPISHTARDWGSYTTVVGYYKCWSARYTSLFLMSLNPLAFGNFAMYKWVPLLIIIGLFFSIRAYLKSLWGNTGPIKSFALTLTVFFLLHMPDLTGGLYYLGGSLFYQPGNIILGFLLASFFRSPPPAGLKQLTLRDWLTGIFQGFLLVLLAGCNEIGMLLALVISASGFIGNWFTKKNLSAGWALMLLVSITAALIILKSPATFYRMEASGSFSRTYNEVALRAIKEMGLSVFRWFYSPSLLLMCTSAFFLPFEKQENRQFYSYRFRGITTLFSLLILYLSFLPSFLGEGLLQGRTENSLLFLFLLLVFLNLFIWKQSLPEIALPQKIQLILPIVLFISFSLSPGFRLATSDLLSGEAAAYSAERDARNLQMRETTGDTVWVKPLMHKPKSLFAGDIGDYPDPWYDNHFAALYGKKWVQLERAKK